MFFVSTAGPLAERGGREVSARSLDEVPRSQGNRTRQSRWRGGGGIGCAGPRHLFSTVRDAYSLSRPMIGF